MLTWPRPKQIIPEAVKDILIDFPLGVCSEISRWQQPKSVSLHWNPPILFANVVGVADYDVALSFAGEQRFYVEMVNDQLKGFGVSTFYDEDNRAFLWGKEMNETLTDVYQNRAKFVLMFISGEYASKVWPTVERRAAFANAITINTEYVLPARFALQLVASGG
jgi:hypothetical protein